MVWIPRDITDTELALLHSLWSRGPSTIRELTDLLYPDGTHSHYATVQSLLDRLEHKQCVSHRRQGRVKVYTATVTRGQVITRRLRETSVRMRELEDAGAEVSVRPETRPDGRTVRITEVD